MRDRAALAHRWRGAIGDVEHDVGAFVGDGDDPAGLLDDVDLCVTGSMGHIDGLVERADVEQRHGRFHERRGNGHRCRHRRVHGGSVEVVGGPSLSTVVEATVSAGVGGGPDPNESSEPLIGPAGARNGETAHCDRDREIVAGSETAQAAVRSMSPISIHRVASSRSWGSQVATNSADGGSAGDE